MKRASKFFFAIVFLCSVLNCSKSNSAGSNNGNNNGSDTSKKGAPVSYFVTEGDQSSLLLKQPDLNFGTKSNSFSFIDVDSAQTFQTVDGFGFTLTGGSASVINQMNATDKAALLQELFSTSNASSIGISYLRLSIGASDLSASVFSYDDVSSGQTDELLAHFSLDNDKADLIPLLKEIVAINPVIKIIAAPWSSPVWMKDNGSSKGGSLKPEYYTAYANYFVKYIQAMKAEGINIDAVTPQLIRKIR